MSLNLKILSVAFAQNEYNQNILLRQSFWYEKFEIYLRAGLFLPIFVNLNLPKVGSMFAYHFCWAAHFGSYANQHSKLEFFYLTCKIL